MDEFINLLKAGGFKGDMSNHALLLDECSRDLSLFQIQPSLIVAPRTRSDYELIVASASTALVSLSARGLGTDTSGGSLGPSIIVDTTRYADEKLDFDADKMQLTLAAGATYQTAALEANKHRASLPFDIAQNKNMSIGGLVGKNWSGATSYSYGSIANHIVSLRAVLADGHSYDLKPLKKQALVQKMAKQTFEGQLYRQLFMLLEENYERIATARPLLPTNLGYQIWDVWNRETGIFDITKLFAGSQGTLGIVTSAAFQLKPVRKVCRSVLCSVDDIRSLPLVLERIAHTEPLAVEGFDDSMLDVSLHSFSQFRKSHGHFAAVRQTIEHLGDLHRFVNDAPRFVIKVSYAETTAAEADKKVELLRGMLNLFAKTVLLDGTANRPFGRWSYGLMLRRLAEGRVVPLLEDITVPIEMLPNVIGSIRRSLARHHFPAVVMGNVGRGSLSIVPILDVSELTDLEKVLSLNQELINIITKNGGSISGIWSDGLARGYLLREAFGDEIFSIMKSIKTIFDPKDVFSPHLKTGATAQNSTDHLKIHF